MNASARPFSVRIFLPDGDPAGLKVIEKSNWTGSGLVVPRSLFVAAKTRPEFERTGVYILVGESDRGPLPQVYIGEGDPVRPRLEQHAKAKDFWTHAIVFTSKDQNLNKAHVQRLESRLVEIASAGRRCVLDNGNMPQPPSLSEADTAEAEGFLSDLLLLVATLGYDFLEHGQIAPASSASVVLYLSGRGVHAQGFETTQGFVVRTGSEAARDEVASCNGYVRDIRAELVRQDVLKGKGDLLELTQDYTFASPSAAASVLLGRNRNGREAWKTSDGRTLKSIQDGQSSP